MKKIILFLIILIYFAVFMSGVITQRIDHIDGNTVKIIDVEKQINEIMKKCGVAGLSCTIINDFKVVYSKAFGFRDKKRGIANDDLTIFSGASFSKTLFGYLIYLLSERGVIDLDKPLYSYLDKSITEYPEYKDLIGDGRVKKITARMVLSHSTGFPNWRFLMEDNKLRFLFDPGARFSYSGEGFHLLQMVVEEVTGMGLEELCRENIFLPLKMNHSSYIWQKSFEDNHALPHDRYLRVKKLSKRRRADSAGSLQTTSRDYGVFIQNLLTKNKSGSSLINKITEIKVPIRSERMFGQSSANLTNSFKKIELGWGLGFGSFNSPFGEAVFHTGHDFGWQNYTITYIEKGIGVVFLSNSDNFESAARDLTKVAIGDSFSPFEWLGYPHCDPTRWKNPPPKRKLVKVDPKVLKKYIGSYSYLGNRTLFVKVEQSGLLGSDDQKEWYRLFAISKSEFFIDGEELMITFILDRNSIVSGLTIRVDGAMIQGKKKYGKEEMK